MTRLREVLVGLICLGLGIGLGGAGTFSAWGSQSASAGNRVSAGDVELADDDADVPIYTVGSAQPGAQPPKCIVVRNSGSIPAYVRVYATVSGGLAPYLQLKITRGTATSPTGGSCATFAADTGAGATVFDGRLNTFPTTSATALSEPGPWAVAEAHAYRFELTLDGDPGGQGLTASASFTWEGRSS